MGIDKSSFFSPNILGFPKYFHAITRLSNTLFTKIQQLNQLTTLFSPPTKGELSAYQARKRTDATTNGNR